MTTTLDLTEEQLKAVARLILDAEEELIETHYDDKCIREEEIDGEDGPKRAKEMKEFRQHWYNTRASFCAAVTETCGPIYDGNPDAYNEAK